MKKLTLIILLLLLMDQVITAQDEDLSIIVSGWNSVFADDGLDRIDSLIETYPDWSEGYVMRALYWRVHKDAENFDTSALNSLETATNIVSEDDFMFMEIEGSILFYLENFDEAELVFLELINHYPYSMEAHSLLSQLYIQENRPEDALKIVKLAQRLNPLAGELLRIEHEIYEILGTTSNLSFLMLIENAHFAWANGEPAKGIDSLQEAIELAEESEVINEFDEALAVYTLGYFSRTREGLNPNSDETIQRMMDLVPDWDLPYLSEIELLFSLGDNNIALEKSNQAIERFPNSPELYFLRGQIYEKLNSSEAALEDYWTYGQLLTLRQVDYSRFQLINQNTAITVGGGWKAIYNFEALEGASFSFITRSGQMNNYLVVLLDEMGNRIGVDVYYNNPSVVDELELDLTIPANGNYQLEIIGLAPSWFPSSIEVDITLR
jgi:tetratricopeptide (TPR) repeat protein